MNGNLDARLMEIKRREDPDSINYEIAETLLDHLYDLPETSAQYLSRLCAVTRPALSRFVSDLGYPSYLDFRLDLNNYTNKNEKSDAYEGLDFLKIQDLFTQNVKTNIDLLCRNIDQNLFQKLIHDLIHTDKVYLMGHLQSGSTAESLGYTLSEVHLNPTVIKDPAKQKEILSRLDGDEVVVIFSAGGHFLDDYFANDSLPAFPKDAKIYFLTSDPDIQPVPGTRFMNLATSKDMSGCNVSLDLLASLIPLCAKNEIENNKKTS